METFSTRKAVDWNSYLMNLYCLWGTHYKTTFHLIFARFSKTIRYVRTTLWEKKLVFLEKPDVQNREMFTTVSMFCYLLFFGLSVIKSLLRNILSKMRFLQKISQVRRIDDEYHREANGPVAFHRRLRLVFTKTEYQWLLLATLVLVFFSIGTWKKHR